MFSSTELVSFTVSYGFAIFLAAALAPLVYVGLGGVSGYKYSLRTAVRLLRSTPAAFMLEHPMPLVAVIASLFHAGIVIALAAHLVLAGAQWNGGLYKLSPTAIEAIFYAKKASAVIILSGVPVLLSIRLYTGARFRLFNWKHFLLAVGDLLLLVLAATGLMMRGNAGFLVAHVVTGLIAVVYFIILLAVGHRLYSRALAENRVLEV
ncbi:MAG TPA: hypothetical protein EYH50_02090 [Pyrodictium delaneyi]|uniref:Uncharacterized protein n=1 Tax=Pyrodictium delaneyi TaxID=1273541 RepID=A0A833A1F3_9CREN|nr:hypothetical protein [Pyrodictium delaneyi]